MERPGSAAPGRRGDLSGIVDRTRVLNPPHFAGRPPPMPPAATSARINAVPNTLVKGFAPPCRSSLGGRDAQRGPYPAGSKAYDFAKPGTVCRAEPDLVNQSAKVVSRMTWTHAERRPIMHWHGFIRRRLASLARDAASIRLLVRRSPASLAGRPAPTTRTEAHRALPLRRPCAPAPQR